MSWIDKINQVWQGDCLELMKEMPDKSIDLIITDPPYGILPKGKINDHFVWDNIDLILFTQKWFNESFKKLKQDSFMFIFWSQKNLKQGFEIFNPHRLFFWGYDNLIFGGNGDFAYDYEPVFVVKKGNPKLVKGKHSCKLHFTKPQSNFKLDRLQHPTQKPLELIKHLIKLVDNTNLIMDPFMGSWTTARACMDLERNFIGAELSEKYCEIGRNRLKQQVLL